MSKQYLSDLELKKKEIRDTYSKSLLSKKEVCREIGCSVASVDRLRLAGRIKSRLILGSIKISTDELARFLVEES